MAPIVNSNMDILGYIYALALGFGGLMGLVRRGSWISAISGALFSSFAFYGASCASAVPSDVYPGLYLSWLLFFIMAARTAWTEKFMPSGVIMTVSLIMGVYYALLVTD